jgi:ribosomal protein L40E
MRQATLWDGVAELIMVSPVLILILLIAFVVIATTTASRRRKLNDQRYDVRVCGQCGATQPPHAGFCRDCGARL